MVLIVKVLFVDVGYVGWGNVLWEVGYGCDWGGYGKVIVIGWVGWWWCLIIVVDVLILFS